jgi:hypothetical protein
MHGETRKEQRDGADDASDGQARPESTAVHQHPRVRLYLQRTARDLTCNGGYMGWGGGTHKSIPMVIPTIQSM